MDWIKVENQLPKENERVLVLVIDKDRKYIMHVGNYGNEFWIIGNYFHWDIGDPVYWMKLPDLPTELTNLNNK